VFAWSIVGPPVDAADVHLVLVAGAASPITGLSVAEVRRLYLGVPITRDGHGITPVRNSSDATVREMFLQRVLFMSSMAYERQISARIFRTGGNRLPEYFNLRDVVAALAADPWAISYMSEDTAAGLGAVKVIGGL
jgi:hypothetical protein